MTIELFLASYVEAKGFFLLWRYVDFDPRHHSWHQSGSIGAHLQDLLLGPADDGKILRKVVGHDGNGSSRVWIIHMKSASTRGS